ncbi:hypothetical protein B5566_18580 [Mycobacterium sp. MHSD3]|jgi:hypothetical protein|uniref:hypothetical protein n=1 Tax=Mycobacteroides chelonae TaxID=1774 RepID=UPI0008AA4086|nr:hypothetical protein [Mycobacteroides chelonae]PKQ56380.1 hypothetical protein B5566_18580 [Mycobacterium sp. MHSD3]SKM19941.1 Uncharacterised protein [Mycobacteroides abscessus subsp. bolletii]AYM41143.1 hypothetical protein DYE20_05895 [[Mycobacterium] chelonae subsp. gwanakae]MBF9520353.1 hypothetical protein [Mycobacteroides chelonae]OHU12433.1 hypothetical protein BKG75_23375 [Mycobacteroides chelonae]
MMFVLVRRAALLVAAGVTIGVPLAWGVSHADPPCAPGAAACALPTAVVPPAGAHEKCSAPKPGEEVCAEPGDAELHSTPTAHIPAPPLTVAPTKGGAAL